MQVPLEGQLNLGLLFQQIGSDLTKSILQNSLKEYLYNGDETITITKSDNTVENIPLKGQINLNLLIDKLSNKIVSNLVEDKYIHNENVSYIDPITKESKIIPRKGKINIGAIVPTTETGQFDTRKTVRDLIIGALPIIIPITLIIIALALIMKFA